METRSSDTTTFNEWPTPNKEQLAKIINKSSITPNKLKIIPSVFPKIGGDTRFKEKQVLASEFARILRVRTDGTGDDFDTNFSTESAFIELFNGAFTEGRVTIRTINFTPPRTFFPHSWLSSDNSYDIVIPGIQDLVIDDKQKFAVATLNTQ